MIRSQGLKESGNLDMLHLQAEDASVEHQIPIKKIYEGGFENVKKPTELAPEKAEDDFASKINIKKEKFIVPQEVLSYLDEMIAVKKMPLRSLRFDIEFSKSLDEVAQYLSEANISEPDREKLLSFIGYEKSKYIEHGISNKNANLEDFEKALTEARRDYVELLVPYLKKLQGHKKSYAKLMENFGIQKEMPTKSEPKELTMARNEYFEMKKSGFKTTDNPEIFAVEEIAKFQNEIVENLPKKAKELVEKGLKNWDGGERENVSLALMSEDLSLLLVNISPQNGLRPEVEKVADSPIIIKKVAPEPKIEVVEEAMPEKEVKPEASVSGKEVIAFDIEIHKKTRKVEVIREGNANSGINVYLDGVEIASGGAISGIKVKKEFEHNWFMADTDAEIAVKKIKKELSK